MQLEYDLISRRLEPRSMINRSGMSSIGVLRDRQAKVNALPLATLGDFVREAQSPSLRFGDCRPQGRRSQSALMPSVLDRAFKQEL
jgi:hypothetical protein